MPSRRFRIIAYSLKKGVVWPVSWQEKEKELLCKLIPEIVETLQAARNKIQRLMTAEDEAAAKRKKEWEEELERYKRQEDARKAARVLNESRQQLAEIIEKWGNAMKVERFFRGRERAPAGATDAR